jgi:hypothetical protein
MFTALLASAILTLTPFKVELSVKDTKDGDTVSVEKTFRVTVQSDNPITKVEFYVGDTLRDSDSSTPYEFTIDPLNEQEGDFKVSFVAYSSEGERGKKDLTLKIASGASKGLDALIEEGNNALIERKWEEAIHAGRVALKAKAGYNPARIIIARAYMGQGVWDKAQQFAEDALAADANYAEGRELLATINLKKAFTTLNRGGDKNESLKAVADAMVAAVGYRRTNLDAMADKLPAVTAENMLKVADGNIRAMRYDAAIRALWPTFIKDPKRADLGNRIAYAQIRLSRNADAARTLNEMEKQNALDAYGSALQAVLLAIAGQDANSDKVMADAIGNDPENLGVRTGQVYVALKRGRSSAFGNLVTSLAKDEGQRTEVNTYLFIMLDSLRSFTDADERFLQAVLTEPANSDAYIERGNQALYMVSSGRIKDANDVAYQFAAADAYYQAGLKAWPESGQALTAIALLRARQNKWSEATTYADAAIKAAPGYAPGQYAASMIFTTAAVDNINTADALRKAAKGTPDEDTRKKIADLEARAADNTDRAKKAKDAAVALDQRNLSGRSIPKTDDVIQYFYQHGRVPLLTTP